MPLYLLVLAAAVFVVLWWRELYKRRGKSIMPATFFVLALVVMGGLALTGKMHWLGVVIVFLLGLLRRLVAAFLPFLLRLVPYWWSRRKSEQGSGQGGDTSYDTKMDRRQALEVLGVEKGADRETILAAHRKLIQKLHPDRGGNTHLTRTVNQARDVLLRDLERKN